MPISLTHAPQCQPLLVIVCFKVLVVMYNWQPSLNRSMSKPIHTGNLYPNLVYGVNLQSHIFLYLQQFFPSHLIDSKSLRGSSPEILCTGEERYKNILLQRLFDSCTPPDIQGYLSMKEGKKSWKKYFCVLRSSGLYYSSKGTSKVRDFTLKVLDVQANTYISWIHHIF